MSVVRDDSDERQTRVNRMIEEFREAQSRRVRKANDAGVESKPDANTTATTGSAISHGSVVLYSREHRTTKQLWPERRGEQL